MRLQRHLNELFKTDVPMEIERDTLSTFRTSFKVGDIKYIFRATQYDEEGWHISFVARGKGITDTEGILGTGNAAKVFAAIIKAFKMFIKSHRPHSFYFYGKEKSRQKLYDRFSKMIAKAHGGYTFEKYVDPEWPQWGMRYNFKKKKRKKSKKLSEIKVTRKFDLKKGRSRYGDWTSSFKIGDLKYDVFITSGLHGEYSISFGVLGKPLEILGTGNAFKVFAAVAQSIKEFLKDMDKKGEPVELLAFTADAYHPSRIKLYDRFAKKFEKMFGFRLIDRDDIGGDIEYVFKRIK